MAAKSAAQEEFDSIVQRASTGNELSHHPDDSEDYRHDQEHGDRDEEEEYLQTKVDENMRMPAFDRIRGGNNLRLPPKEFDRGRTTGVKGVIADARSYEEARQSVSWRSKLSRRGSGSRADKRASTATFLKDDGEGSASEDEEFLERWREQRRMELQREGSDIRNRRTSPSIRRFGRFDEVDALGYLDAIEKVGRDTIVVVFVYDHEVCTLPWFGTGVAADSLFSVGYHKSSLMLLCLSSQVTLQSTSFEFTTKISSSTMPASLPFSHTKIKATSLQTLPTSSTKFQTTVYLIPEHWRLF